MRNIFRLIRDSYSSHFDDADELKGFLFKKYIPINLFFSAAYVVSVKYVSKDVLNAVITLFSILIGFSYSAMIFLSANPRGNASDSSDREAKLRWERINQITKSLYQNLHLFCFSAVFLVFVSLIGIAYQSVGAGVKILSMMFDSNAMVNIINFAYVSFLIEICCEFYRILTRTNYLFSERIR